MLTTMLSMVAGHVFSYPRYALVLGPFYTIVSAVAIVTAMRYALQSIRSRAPIVKSTIQHVS